MTKSTKLSADTSTYRDAVSFMKDEAISLVNHLTGLTDALTNETSLMEKETEDIINDYDKDKALVTDDRLAGLRMSDLYTKLFIMDQYKITSKIIMLYQIAGESLLDGLSTNTKNIIKSIIEDSNWNLSLSLQDGKVKLDDEEAEKYIRAAYTEEISRSEKDNIIAQMKTGYDNFKKQRAELEKRQAEIAKAQAEAKKKFEEQGAKID